MLVLSGTSGCLVESYIGCPYPCPWVLGGHEFDIIVHGWVWMGMGGYCFKVGMDGHSFQVGTKPMPIDIA